MKSKPWNMMVGVGTGLIIGALLWRSRYVPGAGLFQNPQILIVPAALGALIVSLRNRRKKVGPYDPDVIARNRKGRV
jgi:hypothetical protein